VSPERAGPAGGDERRYDLDWLRVSVFLLLILYHVGMFFVPWGWHIKNPEPAGQWLMVPMFFVSQWRLALLFLVSGAAAHFALRRRTAVEFARERVTRLLVPLVFGMLVVVPPQVYYERLTQGAAYSSYLAHLPYAFRGGPYPAGNVSWHHLWFVAYALVFALAALPLFRVLRTERGRRWLETGAAWLGRPRRIFLLALPVTASEMALRASWPTTHTLVGDWANLSTYFILFVYGHVLYAVPALGEALERERRTALALGVAASGGLILVWQAGLIPAPGYAAPFLGWLAAKSLNTCFWLVALTGYARRRLHRPSPVLRHANEAVYPYYILHQTVIVAIAYHLMDWDAAVSLKFLVIAAATLAVTTALYLVLRLHPLTRVLFGMKPSPARPARPASHLATTSPASPRPVAPPAPTARPAAPVAGDPDAGEIRAWR
jgi:glucans biosynthesis protein C